MMKKKLTTFIIACAIGTSIYAGGNTGLGLRISTFSDATDFGITLNHHFSRGTTLEGIAEFPNSAVIITGLYEKFHSLTRSHTFFFYYGGGIYIGSGGGATAAGLRGVVGLSYGFKDLPIEIGIDWMPALQITPKIDGSLPIFGLSVRFTF
jgi:hypothetical protein